MEAWPQSVFFSHFESWRKRKIKFPSPFFDPGWRRSKKTASFLLVDREEKEEGVHLLPVIRSQKA